MGRLETAMEQALDGSTLRDLIPLDKPAPPPPFRDS